ncbi:MAG: universal stress protein [Deltaproteobacteria bacterium]|jgi:nucleotide-binding universal stress UspA family protein|nr:universal stress protein [Deltaproteobacteria bacterium]MBN2844469.1 universal stress protein [Deltaproteobacteria bacterium]
MFKKILYPTDFSDVAQKALDFIKELKNAGAEEVVILHVIDKRFFDAIAWYTTKDLPEMKRDLLKEVTSEIEPIEKELKDLGFKVKVRIETGDPFTEILRVEREENVSSMAIGSHGVSNIEEMFLGSVSEKVIRKAKKPVHVIKR